MRADRLLAMMLLLQNRGKLTANVLAEELSVSRRTILRDVEALSLAGVPIYAEGGHGGGIALDEAYRSRLTGLHTPEVQALFINSNQAVLRDVGLDDASQQLMLKLMATLPVSHHLTVEHIRQRLMIDPVWWWYEDATPAFWDVLQQAVYEDRRIMMTYENYAGDIVERVLEPYSLVNKSSQWYLVARRDDDFRTYRVARIHNLQVQDTHFKRLPEFDLENFWKTHLAGFMQTFSEYECILRINPERVTFVKWLLPGRWDMLEEADSRGWMVLRLSMDSPLLARMIVFGLGTDCEVVVPKALIDELLQSSREFMQHLQQIDTSH